MELYIRIHGWWEVWNLPDIKWASVSNQTNKRKARVNTLYRQTVRANDHIAHIYHKNSLPRILFHFIINILNICDEAHLPNTSLVFLKTSSLGFGRKKNVERHLKSFILNSTLMIKPRGVTPL